jgi:4-aminobutyrate aminotransferase
MLNRVASRSCARVCSGEGAWIHATNGRKYLDLTSGALRCSALHCASPRRAAPRRTHSRAPFAATGIGVTSLGHCHPRIVKAVQAQAAKLLHGQINCYTHQPYMDLIDKMRAVLPRSLDSVFLANAGAESIENAIKLARHATGRPNVIVFQGEHSLGASAARLRRPSPCAQAASTVARSALAR